MEDVQIKRVALVLHAMHAEDSKEIMYQLGADIGIRLTSYLSELESLGFPRQTELLKEISVVDMNEKHEPLNANDNFFFGLSANIVFEALKNEPTRVIAMILIDENPSWRNDFLSQLSIKKRNEVTHLLEKNFSLGIKQKEFVKQIFRDKIDQTIKQIDVSHGKNKLKTGWKNFILKFLKSGRTQ